MASAILDHLWQSTLVALVAGVLIAAAFRRAPAAVRHGLWFAASLKFLIPFAALAALGRLLAPAGLTPAGAAPEAALIAQAARPLARFPFADPAALQAPPVPSPPSALAQAPPMAHAAPHVDVALVLLAVWAFGCGAIVMAWAIRWARVRAVVRAARPIAWPAPMPVLASPSLMEPGLVGFLRPVLVVPETLPGRLTRSEIEAILAHEISHLDRRDNLSAATHMLVEALFWFHPLVWWIGARLIDERERACDEAVVAAGHDRAAYARGLVESCRLYLQSPLSCVAGASGSTLATRVETIMNAPPSSPLSPLKKALLLAAGACAFATPVAAGLLTSPEARKAVGRVTAAAAGRLGSPASIPAPDSQPAGPVLVARNQPVVAPALTVARLDAPQARLSHDIAAPAAVGAVAPDPAPVQLAVATPPRPAASTPRPAPLAATPDDAKTLAASFVKAYADTTPYLTIGRWASPICIRVVGLTADQETAVRLRVKEVAASVGLAARAECQAFNVQIGFAENAQAMLDSVRAMRPDPLGDRTSDTRGVKTVTLPIQAWYVTNGELYADNDRSETGGLEVRVLYQTPTNPSGMPSASFSPTGSPFGSTYFGGYGAGGGTGFGGGLCCATSSAPPAGGVRAFTNVMVIVDLRRTGGVTLGALADYAAMLALSEPRTLGQCAPLPSITDLFANCPGRAAPDGLTAADTAYLTALYSAGGATLGSSHRAHVIQRMADLLVHPQVASR
jgi:beta-lactamase regulating signal transducer with metallopeptidase domain